MRSAVYDKLITDICREEDISLTRLSMNWVLELTKNAITRHIIGNRYDINRDAAVHIASDKAACHKVLENAGIPSAAHTLLFNPASRRGKTAAQDPVRQACVLLESYGGQGVLKPNEGQQGEDVFYCDSEKKLKSAMKKLFAKHDSICLSPYFEIETEYRVFCLFGTCLHMYAKQKPYAIGDGVSTVRQLAKSAGVICALSSAERTRVPEKGEEVCLSWKHNLSGGAVSRDIIPEDEPELIQAIAEKGARATGLDYCTVDIMRTGGGQLAILEVNATVAIKKYLEQHPEKAEICKEIMRKAILAMFI